VDKIYLLKHIVLDNSGQISLCELFNNFSRVIEHPIASPILAFYNVAYIIERRLKLSTVEFVFKNGLTLEQELNINDFYLKISDSLKIDDITSIIVFKGLDYSKKGKIKVEDFVVVIDSYRNDIGVRNTKGTPQGGRGDFYVIKSDIEYFKEQLGVNTVTVDEIYERSKGSGFTNVLNALRALLNDTDMTRVENVLCLIKTEDNKVNKVDIQKLLAQDKIDNKFIFDMSKSKAIKTNKYGLNDAQIYWINKLISLLESINVTPLMAFEAAIEKNKGEINLDTYKKKLNILISPGKVTATELNYIADSLNVYNNRVLPQQDYIDIIGIAESDPRVNLFSASTHVKDSKNNFKNPLYNTFTDNENNLPIRGNNKAIQTIRDDFNKTNFSFKSDGGDVNKLLNSLDGKPQAKNNNFVKTEVKKEEVTEEFVKDLDVFEHGEWSLIELLEETKITTKNSLPSYDLFGILVNKYTPAIPKDKLYKVLKLIDTNQDGMITNYDLISFLLNTVKHSSTKLALKEIARSIEYDHNLSTEDYFSRKYLQPNHNLNFVTFTQFFVKNFEINPPVVKKLFDEIKHILNGKENITVADVIDIINEYREANSKVERKKELVSISVLDKKFYEEEMRNFVRRLHKGFGCINVKQTLLKDNLLYFLSPTNTMNLYYFRENFIKSLGMDLPLGIATFQLLKSFSNKDESVITKDDLFNLIYSYTDIGITKFDPEVIVTNLENNGMPLKYCLGEIYYNPGGIAAYEVLRCLESYYPKFHKSILLALVKFMDRLSLGVLTYKDLSDAIYQYSKKDNLAPLLMIKHVASILDTKACDSELLSRDLKAKFLQKANICKSLI
jgi:hypothetical protein